MSFPIRATICVAVTVLVVTAAGSAEASLLVHYKFDQVDGGTTTPDASGNGLTGTLGGEVSTTPVTGQIVNALQFNGSRSNVSVADGSAGILDTTFAEFTFSAWIQPGASATNRARRIAGKMGLTGSRGWEISRNTSGDVAIDFFDGPSGNEQILVTSGLDIPSTSFTHIAAVFKSNDYLRLYVNGDLQAELTEAVDDVLSVLNGANSTNFQVGNRGDSRAESTAASWGGLIDDVGIWDEALIGGQIESIYQAGLNGLDLQAVPEPSGPPFGGPPFELPGPPFELPGPPFGPPGPPFGPPGPPTAIPPFNVLLGPSGATILAVPEPSTFSLAAISFIVLFGYARQRKRWPT